MADRIFQDDKWYKSGQQPDLGSITPVRNVAGVRDYFLLSADISKLNSVVTYCKTGSTAFVQDTGAVYTFHADAAAGSKWAEV